MMGNVLADPVHLLPVAGTESLPGSARTFPMALHTLARDEVQKAVELRFSLRAENIVVELEHAPVTVAPFSNWPVVATKHHRLRR